MSVRILVIEDDSDVRAFMVEALAREGHVVEDASDGVEGLQCAREHRPDLILLDLMMPTMDGWAFLEEQKRDERLAGVPVILVSGCPEEKLEELDADAYLSKAQDLDEVLDFVARWSASAAP
jgi:CheY-like chemotaxis protein